MVGGIEILAEWKIIYVLACVNSWQCNKYIKESFHREGKKVLWMDLTEK